MAASRAAHNIDAALQRGDCFVASPLATMSKVQAREISPVVCGAGAP
jgi:hypothetical protein